MKTSTQILPGIKALGWLDCRALPKRVDLSAICGMPVAILTDIHPIPFFDEPTCECKTKKDGGDAPKNDVEQFVDTYNSARALYNEV